MRVPGRRGRARIRPHPRLRHAPPAGCGIPPPRVAPSLRHALASCVVGQGDDLDAHQAELAKPGGCDLPRRIRRHAATTVRFNDPVAEVGGMVRAVDLVEADVVASAFAVRGEDAECEFRPRARAAVQCAMRASASDNAYPACAHGNQCDSDAIDALYRRVQRAMPPLASGRIVMALRT